ncbi:MAG: PEP-CTERM sorting domain-containing protein [Chthoniobacterales bacterium]
MKKYLLTISLVILTTLGLNAAQLINAPGVAYIENFNSYNGTSTLPANFTFSDSDFTPGGYYNSAASYNNSNSSYALFSSAVSSTDFSFGQKGPTSGTDFLNWSFTNNTGADITSFQVSWDFKQFSESGRATTLSFNYNPNNTGWTTTGITGSLSSTATTNATTANLSDPLVDAKSVTVDLAVPLANGEGILFGWGFRSGVGTGGNAHIGVDNISVLAIPEPGTASLLTLSFCALAWVRRRRNT